MIDSMRRFKSRSMLFVIFYFILAGNSFSQITNNNLQARLDSLLSSDFFKSSQIAIDIYDLTNKEPVFNKNEKLLLRPASVEKILTTCTALLFLDDDFTFKTKIYHTGEIDDSVCYGDLYIVGGFDPDFTSHDLDSLVREIKNYGINEIRGNLYADVSAGDSLFWGNGWMWDDDPGPFAAYLSPLNIDDNSIEVIYEPGIIGKPANIELLPQNNFIPIKNNSITSDTGKTTIKISRDWINRQNTITLTGNIKIYEKRDTTSVNIFNPNIYFLHLMEESLNRNSIKLIGKVDTLTLNPEAEEIFTIERNIDTVLVNMNKTSDNLSAEMVLRAIASSYFPKPATAENGIIIVDSLITIAGFNSSNYKIADGSGLSFYNLISPELVTGILKYFYYDEEDLFVKLYNTFPISGYDGTLENRMKNSRVERRVHAKTGTLSGASNLAGYLQTKSGSMLAFSIFVHNYVEHATQARKFQDKICEILFEEL